MARTVRAPSQPHGQLSIHDFQYQGLLDDKVSSSHSSTKQVTASEKTALKLREARDRLAKGIPIGGNKLCCTTDRAAALHVYYEALNTINSTNHETVLFEATLKVETILGILKADPHDVVFSQSAMLLNPLEPQYAEPRIKYNNDKNGYRAAWRLKAWRKAGWPGAYPGRAIRGERKIEKLPRGGGRGDIELRKKMEDWAKEDWGDEVDASSESWKDL